jgi:hypothetical protein
VLSPGANALTPVSVTTVSHVDLSGFAREQAIASMVSAANHAVIQRVASGTVEVPGFGRVAVRANRDGNLVDVDVSSERTEASAVLHASAGAMAADLRQADIPLRHLRFNGTEQASLASNPHHQGETGRQSNRGTPEGEPADVEETDGEVGSLRSVRIVL